MSLINKMLQDLDARGSKPVDGAPPSVKAVPDSARAVPPRLAAAAVVLALLVVVAGFFGWRALQRGKVTPVPLAALGNSPAPAPAVPAKPSVPAPAPQSAVAATVAPAAASNVPAAKAPVAVSAPAPATSPGTVPGSVPGAVSGAVSGAAPTAKPAAQKKAAASVVKLASAPIAKPPEAAPQPGREMSDQQRAESEYRRGLATMQEGRVAEAMLALEKALTISPQHEAARQTLVGLLLEGHRYDEAMRHLQLGLTLDPRQPAMAMLLARLQIERGGPGIDTLMRTLPYAEASPDYQAFLAGALQREQRHREAADHYLAAVRRAPDNGVWWMGMGISLQAEKRSAEALDAFQRARASSNLSPELQAFVDRKLVQLGH